MKYLSKRNIQHLFASLEIKVFLGKANNLIHSFYLSFCRIMCCALTTSSDETHEGFHCGWDGGGGGDLNNAIDFEPIHIHCISTH